MRRSWWILALCVDVGGFAGFQQYSSWALNSGAKPDWAQVQFVFAVILTCFFLLFLLSWLLRTRLMRSLSKASDTFHQVVGGMKKSIYNKFSQPKLVTSERTIEELKTATAIAAVIEDRRGAARFATFLLIATLLLHFVLTEVTGTRIDIWLLLLIVTGLILINASTIVLNYRVKHGLYGTNAYNWGRAF